MEILLTEKQPYSQRRMFGCAQYCWANLFYNPKYLNFIPVFKETGSTIQAENEMLRVLEKGSLSLVPIVLNRGKGFSLSDCIDWLNYGVMESNEFAVISVSVASLKRPGGRHAVLWLVNSTDKVNWVVELDPWNPPTSINPETYSREVFSLFVLTEAEVKQGICASTLFPVVFYTEDFPWIFK